MPTTLKAVLAAAAATSLVALALLAAAAPRPAFAHGKAHVHGVAEMQVSMVGSELRIAFASPLENLVGFERAPRDEPERATIRKMAELLRSADSIRPSAAARCTVAEMRLASAVIEPALLGETAAAAAKPAAKKDDHADLEMTAIYRCENAQALQAVEINLLKAFPKLRRIDVQIVGPSRQTIMRLTGDRRSISLK